MTTHPLIDKLRTENPGMRVAVRTRKWGNQWWAQVCAGWADGPSPIWEEPADTEEEAISRALESAVSYWCGSHGSGVSPEWLLHQHRVRGERDS